MMFPSSRIRKHDIRNSSLGRRSLPLGSEGTVARFDDVPFLSDPGISICISLESYRPRNLSALLWGPRLPLSSIGEEALGGSSLEKIARFGTYCDEESRCFGRKLAGEVGQFKYEAKERISSMEGRLSNLEDMMKKIFEPHTQPATSEARALAGDQGSGGNPNIGTMKDDREVEILGDRENMSPLEPITRRKIDEGYNMRRNWEEETKRADFEEDDIYERRRAIHYAYARRTSTFRKICDELVSKFGEQFVERLREININQFLLLPSIPQNVPLVHMLLMQWDMSKECFVINGEMIKFTSEEVALLVGLPNRGLKFEIGSGRIYGVTANDIRHNIEEMNVATPTEDLVKEFIVYLLSNIFFPMGNFRVPTGIEEVATNVDTFGTYNWPESIRDFLVKEFNSIADKHSKGFSLGYVNGFVHILINVIDEQSRPHFTRWEGNFMYSEKEVNNLFADLKKAEIFPNFKAITEAERMLIDNSSTHPQIEQLQIDLPRQSSPDVSSRPSSPTPSSPPIIPTPSQIPTPYSPQRDPIPSQFTTPSSPPRIATPSQIPTSSSPPRMPSPGQFPSTSHKEPFTVHLSNPPPAETPNWDSVNEAINNLISRNKFLLNKVTSLESSNDYLTRRVAALEQAVFELKEANLKDDNVQKLMSEENPASVKPTQSACSEKSSSRTQTSKNIVSPSSVVAPNVVEEEQENIQDVINLFEPQTDKLKTNEEEGRRKKEKLPAKKKVILPIAEPSKEQVPVPVDAAPSKSAELGPVAAESIEVGAAPVDAALDKTPELVPVDATPFKKTEDDQIIVTEIDESIPTDPQAAPEIIDYPGRELISVEKKFFIDKCLRYFKYR
ncbi:hypothetical protein M5K25_014526 [Dendrobium thyrsiflorum]|uniref:Uncharacterized protein n=1 Tax=Dendrobium thyrsiflorum TaxID=117978 RepID=A0ABD0UWX6_DENTH